MSKCKFSLLLSSLPPPQLKLSDPGRSFMTGEGGISTMLGLISLLLDFLRRLLDDDPNEMDRPFAWAFLCPLINWFVLAIKSFFRSKKSEDLRGGASIITITYSANPKKTENGRVEFKEDVIMCVCFCQCTKIFVVCSSSSRFILLYEQSRAGDIHGQERHEHDDGEPTTRSPLCVYKWLLRMAHPNSWNSRSPRFSADFTHCRELLPQILSKST